jgi:hypothetical protein
VNAWPEFDDFAREAMRDKARPNIANKTEAYGHMSDEWVANRVRMLHRSDLEFEPICSAGRDRIMRLSMEVAELRGILAARRADETAREPARDAEHCDFPDCEQHYKYLFLLALSHVDMGALEISHRKDWATLRVGKTGLDHGPAPETAEKPVSGCPIHGRCPVCTAMDVLGDPRVGVVIAGPDAGAVFKVGSTLYTAAPNAAAAAQPGVFAWVCTKHGNIPFQDCAQCAEEQVKSSGEVAP